MLNHKPCVTDDDVLLRLMDDQVELDQMEREGHAMLGRVSYHSDTTLETHCLPVFATDTVEDLANRYYDFFPKECTEFFAAVEDQKRLLYQGNGMSVDETLAIHCTIPNVLWKMLVIRFPDAYNTAPGLRKLTREIIRYLPKLKMSQPYGRFSIAV